MANGRERLRQWIDRSKLNQLEAAQIIGVDHTQLSHILLGRRRPGLDTAVKIERATGITVEAWTPIDDGDSEPIESQSTVNAQIDKA
jgi:transcriptional regulator with XRE-family HTH domain